MVQWQCLRQSYFRAKHEQTSCRQSLECAHTTLSERGRKNTYLIYLCWNGYNTSVMVEFVLVSYLPVKGITWTAIGIHKSLRLPVELRLTKALIQSFVHSINYRCECNKKFYTVTVSSNGRGFATHK